MTPRVARTGVIVVVAVLAGAAGLVAFLRSSDDKPSTGQWTPVPPRMYRPVSWRSDSTPTRSRSATPSPGRWSAGPDSEGSWYWRARWWQDSVRHSESIGWLHKDEANDELIKLASSGEHKERAAASTGVETVKDVLETWLPQMRKKSIKPRTKAIYKVCTKALGKRLGSKVAARVTRNMLEEYVGERIDVDDAAPSTVYQELIALGAAYRWAFGEGHVPALLPDAPPVPDRPGRGYCDRVPEPEEVARVARALSDPWRMALVWLWARAAGRTRLSARRGRTSTSIEDAELRAWKEKRGDWQTGLGMTWLASSLNGKLNGQERT